MLNGISAPAQQYFAAGTFKTLVWDPSTGKAKLIPTPADMFCGGHAFLPDGRLLVAGGTWCRCGYGGVVVAARLARVLRRRRRVLGGSPAAGAAGVVVLAGGPGGEDALVADGEQAGQPEGERGQAGGPPRAFRTAKLELFHAARCRFRYSLWTSCGVR